ncbi:MAG: hypothetical protein IIU39_07050, partial [Ruminococcus sp.]|nr:hypothetical protein [Ruminococcus sp.]
ANSTEFLNFFDINQPFLTILKLSKTKYKCSKQMVGSMQASASPALKSASTESCSELIHQHFLSAKPV